MEPLFSLAISLPARGSRLQDLHRQLRAAIVDGRLGPGMRLPSTRALAAAAGVSRNTVVAAYERLISEGYVAARRGSGTRVAAMLPRPPAGRGQRVRTASDDHRLHPYWRRQRSEAPLRAVPDPVVSFRLGLPDIDAFPFEVWRRLGARRCRAAAAIGSAAGHAQGLPALRKAIARHVSFARAVACEPDDVVVTAGAQQAFDLLARVLVTPRRRGVALEDPGYPPLRAAFEAAGATIAAVPVDEHGIVVGRIPAQARILCVTPSHQFPLGCVLSAPRRTALLELAQARDAIVIEDDYDGEFRYTDRPLDALQTLDRAESVFYVGTFSKSMLPSLRLGYIVAPAWARAALVAAKRVADGQCSEPLQDVAAAFIDGGHLARHVRRMHREYARRRQLLLDIVDRDLSGWLRPLPSAAGLHVAVGLASPGDDRAIAARALRAGAGVRELSVFCRGRVRRQGLVLGFGATPADGIVAGLARLERALAAR